MAHIKHTVLRQTPDFQHGEILQDIIIFQGSTEATLDLFNGLADLFRKPDFAPQLLQQVAKVAPVTPDIAHAVAKAVAAVDSNDITTFSPIYENGELTGVLTQSFTLALS